METKKNKWLVWTENALLPLILALYPLRHVWMGIDLRDTGYNYANFRYMGLAHMDSMWVFSTYLANAVGHFFSLLPGGDTLLFMNIYTALVVSATALIAYFFLVKKCGLPFWTVFAGEFAAVSLCWGGTGSGRKCICPFFQSATGGSYCGRVGIRYYLPEKNGKSGAGNPVLSGWLCGFAPALFGLYQSALRRGGIPGSHKKAVFHDGYGLGLQSLIYGSGSF